MSAELWIICGVMIGSSIGYLLSCIYLAHSSYGSPKARPSRAYKNRGRL